MQNVVCEVHIEVIAFKKSKPRAQTRPRMCNTVEMGKNVGQHRNRNERFSSIFIFSFFLLIEPPKADCGKSYCSLIRAQDR